MRGKGITYDTGFLSAGTSTHEPFDPETVRREMRVIQDDLHCNAVRVTGGYVDRLELAADLAAHVGLEVWISPFTNDLTIDELLDVLADCAVHAEGLRRQGADIVVLTGSEVSLFTKGFFPGDSLQERLALIADPMRVRPLIPEVRARINDFLRQAVELVRARFAGKVSYASLPHEGVDWSAFDIIASDAGYRTKTTATPFSDMIRAFVALGKTQGKPVAITEFGCMTCHGSADAGGSELSMIEWSRDGKPLRLAGDFMRDENEQASYVRQLLDVFEAEGVDSAFVYTFARYDLPHHANPTEDFDVASRGIVNVLGGDEIPAVRRYPGMPWEPKAAFDTLANLYSR